MRWRFLDDGFDLAERDRKILDIDRWWSRFEQKVDALHALFAGDESWDLVEWMGGLAGVHPDLIWEFGPAVDQPGHRLVITPEHRYELTELVRTLIYTAPKIDGWEFYALRLPSDPDTAAGMVKSRTMGSMTDVRVSLKPGENNLIDLHYSSKSPTASNDAFVATEALLGEHALNRWVGEVSASKPAGLFGKGAPDGIPFPELAAAFDRTRREILATLPGEPYHVWVGSAGRAVLQLEPHEADDYAAAEDATVASTASPELWQACHRGIRFDSQRFSRHGETFLYIKIELTEGDTGFTSDNRADIEYALDTVLVNAELGCVTGGIKGIRYAYVDVCLTDLDAGIRAIRTSLQASRVPERSWLLFCDRIWSDEWIGVYDTTPAPPQRNRGSLH
jgi:hypothetical protein